MAPKSAAARIAGALRSNVADLPPGGRLPGERDLADTHEVARGTIRAALAMLVQDGTVIGRPGRGYYRREHPLVDWWPLTFERDGYRRDTPEAGLDAWAADVKAQGFNPRQDVKVSIVEASPLIAAGLDVDPGELVVVRERIRYVDDWPIQTADSYYPMWVAQGTDIMRPGDLTIPGGLMRAAGHPQARFVDELTGRMASDEDAARMDLPRITPVFMHVRVGYDANDRRVRVIVTVAPTDRNRIMFESPGGAA